MLSGTTYAKVSWQATCSNSGINKRLHLWGRSWGRFGGGSVVVRPLNLNDTEIRIAQQNRHRFLDVTISWNHPFADRF